MKTRVVSAISGNSRMGTGDLFKKRVKPKNQMSRITMFALTIFASIFFVSCGPSYRVSTSFYLLNRGMTKEQFINWQGLNDGKNYIGKHPVFSKSFRHGSDVWEVWVYRIYNCNYEYLGCVFDHYEHVAFVNGRLEEWGTGELPITIRQNPNQFQYDININR